MELSTILQLVFTALGGGLIGTFLTFKLNNRKQKASEFQMLLKERKDITEALTNRMDSMEVELRRLREKEAEQAKEISSLRNQLMLFESSHIDIPLPMWLKDNKGKMVFFNEYYEDMFLISRGYTRNDYLGNDDFSVWSEEIAKAFISNDEEVIRTKKHIRKIEKLEDKNGEPYYAEILKYPRKFNRDVIGISGIILRIGKTKDELK